MTNLFPFLLFAALVLVAVLIWNAIKRIFKISEESLRIRNKVAFDKIAPHISSSVGRKLQQVFGSRPIAVWGSRDTDANRAKFDRMAEGDEILIVEGQTIKLLGRVAAKDVNPQLS